MKIAILDDEIGAVNLLKKTLISIDPSYEIHDFTDSQAYLEYIYSNSIDVSFLDIRMPEVSGLEIAKKAKKIQKNMNIIFATGFSDYAFEAMKLRSSGYLLKPVLKEDVKEELEHLRNPISASSHDKGLYVKTFGIFNVYYDGKPVLFKKEKSKELFAYLVHCNGSMVGRKEISKAIFQKEEYSRSDQSYITQIIAGLQKTLEEYGIKDVFISERNNYYLNVSKFSCDSYEYFAGNVDAINAFNGEYMLPYAWGKEYINHFYE